MPPPPLPPALNEGALALAAIDAQRGSATKRVRARLDVYRTDADMREELEARVKAWRQEQLAQYSTRDFVRENRGPDSVRYLCTAVARRTELHATQSSKIVAARARRLEQLEDAEERRVAKAKRDRQRHAAAMALYVRQKQEQRRPATAPARRRVSTDAPDRPRSDSASSAAATTPLLTAEVLQVKRRPQSAAAGRSAVTAAAAGPAGAPAPARPASAMLATSFSRKPRRSWAATDPTQPPGGTRSARPRPRPRSASGARVSPPRVVVLDVGIVEHSVLGRAGGGVSGTLPPAG